MHISEIIIDKGFEGLNPMQYGRENCEIGHFFGPAIRDYWLLHYVVSGKGIYEINGHKYRLKKHDMFVIPPFVKTFYKADDKDPWEYIWIGFTTSSSLPLELPDVIYLPSALSIFEKMGKCSELQNGRSEFLSARLWDLISVIAERENDPTDHVGKAISYMKSEYMNAITVSDISERLNLDRSYFSALFKKRTGKSPQKFLFDLRMETAAKLMKEQEQSPLSAAASVGYTDIYNFSRMFKKAFGLSPRAYIGKHKK